MGGRKRTAGGGCSTFFHGAIIQLSGEEDADTEHSLTYITDH